MWKTSQQNDELFPYLKRGSKSRGINRTAILAFISVPLIIFFSFKFAIDTFSQKPVSYFKTTPVVRGSPLEVPTFEGNDYVVGGPEKKDLAIVNQVVKVGSNNDLWVGGGLLIFNVWAWSSLYQYKRFKKENLYIRILKRGIGGIRNGINAVHRVVRGLAIAGGR